MQPQAEAVAPPHPLLSGEIDRNFAGTLMPDVVLSDPDGREINLAAMQGEPVLLNLWATWCAPCVVELPLLDNLADEMEGKLRVVTVSEDVRGAELVVPFFAEKEFRNLEPWLDPDNELGLALSKYGVLPMTVLFDANGQEVFRVPGGYPWDSEDTIALIEEAISE